MNGGGRQYANPMLTFMPFLNPNLILIDIIPNCNLNLVPKPNLNQVISSHMPQLKMLFCRFNTPFFKYTTQQQNLILDCVTTKNVPS